MTSANPTASGTPSAAAKPVLVAYETRFGSTAEVARAIGAVLAEAGFAAEIRRASEVDDPTRYAAVIVGAPVYSRRWLRAACAWVRLHRDALAPRPVWFFALGIRVPDGPHANERHTLRLLRRLHQLAPDFEPRSIGLFAGAVNPAIVGLREQIQLRVFRPKTGDFRDWAKIRAWAMAVRDELRSAASPPCDERPRAAQSSSDR
ncbi:MAG: flavodoxin domain-containing protein [bacterium]